MEKEIWYQKLNIYFVGFYLIFSICLITYYLANGQLYYATLGLGGILLLYCQPLLSVYAALSPSTSFVFFSTGSVFWPTLWGSPCRDTILFRCTTK